MPGQPHDINEFKIYPIRPGSTWVCYVVAIPVPNGSGGTAEDVASGFAHFLHGRWLNVFGPGTGYRCEQVRRKIPDVRCNASGPICG